VKVEALDRAVSFPTFFWTPFQPSKAF
jgi:hypothetical protein